MNWPPTNQNPLCQCAQKGPMAAMFCRCGHMTECHYPFTCEEAACGHLRRYGFSDEEITHLEYDSRQLIAGGLRAPYALDQDGNVVVVLNASRQETKKAADKPRP